MNFDFSEDSRLLRDQARRFLTDRSPLSLARAALEETPAALAPLWREMAELGWLGAGLPEENGGAGLGAEAICVLAEELGRALTPLPHITGICLAAEAIARFASPAQRATWLPAIAAGTARPTFALAEGIGDPAPDAIRTERRDLRLSGEKWPVADLMAADIVVVAAREGASVTLALLDPNATGVTRVPVETLDPGLPQGRLMLDAAPAERLPGANGFADIAALLDRAAVPAAFAALGGAQAALDAAVAYAKERQAFGRPIGSFQAIKHKLADVYVAVELARSNAWYACWALEGDGAALKLAAATAKVSADAAFFLAAKENIQTHGGIGFTWAADPHLFYRRAQVLQAALGGPRYWRERMVAALETAN